MKKADKEYYVRFGIALQNKSKPALSKLKSFYISCCNNRYKTLWVFFILVQIYLYFTNEPFGSNTYTASGDLKLYHFWIDRGTQFNIWPIINENSVYPPYAFVPMLIAGLPTYQNLFLFKLSWYLLMALFWAIAIRLLWLEVDKSKKNIVSNNIKDIIDLGYGGCFFIPLFMLALGPVFSSRIDCVAAVFGLYGLISLRKNPAISSAWFTVAAWVKVFIGANFIPLLFAARKKIKPILAIALIVTIPVLVLALFCQNPVSVISFLVYQTGRNLQIESILATPSMIWDTIFQAHKITYNSLIFTNEIITPVCNIISNILNYLLILVVLFMLYLIFRARKTNIDELVLTGGLAIFLSLIVFNKVGSPQYYTALLPFFAYALSLKTKAKWIFPSAIAIFIAIFTQLVFPATYDMLLNYSNWHALSVFILSIRNILVVWLYIIIIKDLYKLGDSNNKLNKQKA
ncbi:MAG: hypothetical protein LBT91_01585 [Bifidobacteriaceae bacterium]|jgi:hypothetical protein|nr:hypothetical protein [Bifidobacteriaceae bacterium]